ncbi:hypothetical protein DI494_22450, partial [Stenotrophomonas maltophilia]
ASLTAAPSASAAATATRARGGEATATGETLPGWTVKAGSPPARATRAATDLLYANPPKDLLQLNTQLQLRVELQQILRRVGVPPGWSRPGGLSLRGARGGRAARPALAGGVFSAAAGPGGADAAPRAGDSAPR